MDPIAVDIRLIRAVLGSELKLAPGRAMMARVVAADGLGRGKLAIAGAVIDAELPKHVQAGQELRLTVRHVSTQQVVLGLSDQPLGLAAPAAQLPGGGLVRVAEDDPSGEEAGSGGSPGTRTLSLRYDAPALGPVDLRFDLDPGSLRVSVAVAPGTPLSLAQARADELRDALGAGVGRAATVTVTPRHDPLDVYA
jgi:hypothetical protein